MTEAKPSFSVRHPFLFGLFLLVLAVALFSGAMAFLRSADLLENLDDKAKIGVVNVQGLIADPSALLVFMEELEDDDTVKGVVVRLNTPGGVVAPSQELYQAVLRLRDEKPVVASMGAVAASGGYYVAAAADQIVANPGTLTGSIGVRMEMLNFQDLARELGISQTQLTTGEFKGAGSPFRDMTDREREYFQALIENMHDQFVTDVADGRGMELERVRAVADGRALTGQQAHELGLVDELGGLHKALELCQSLAGLSNQDVPLKHGPKEDSSLLLELLSSESGGLLRTLLGLLRQAEPKAIGPRWQLVY